MPLSYVIHERFSKKTKTNRFLKAFLGINLKLELFFFKFIYFERESVSWGGAEREVERGILSRLCTVIADLDAGLEPMDHEIVTSAEVGHLTD